MHLQASASTLATATVTAASPTGDGSAATATLATAAACASSFASYAISPAITASAVTPHTVCSGHVWHVHQRRL